MTEGSKYQFYMHRSRMKVTLTSDALESRSMQWYLSAYAIHHHISLEKGKKWYRDFKLNEPSYSPITIHYDGEYWGDFDWKKLHIYLDEKGDHEKRLQELIQYFVELADGHLTYSRVITYVEICCFVPRERRYNILSMLRHVSEHYSLNKSEKKEDTSYNGVSEVFVSGFLQINNDEPQFKFKLYEAIREKPIGFKDKGAPKLEMQIEGEFDTWQEPQAFGLQKIIPLLHHHQTETLLAEDVCLDKDGAGSYLSLSFSSDIEGQDNQYIHELLAYARYIQHPEWLQKDLRYCFFEQIYFNGRRSQKALLDAGIKQYTLKKAEKDRMIIACKRKGAGGNSYRVNFLYREDSYRVNFLYRED